MNYNTYSFWLFFLAVLIPYWRLERRGQNRLLLAASYVFYSWWDYRFLFLILISTVIDYIGGLGVAGVQLGAARLRSLAAFLIVGALFLASDVHYAELFSALRTGDGHLALSALAHDTSQLRVPVGTLASVLAYGAALPRLYALPEARRRKYFLVISMVANLAILGFFKYHDFFVTSLTDALSSVGVHASLRTLNLILPAGISFYTFQAMSYTVDVYRGHAEPTDDFWDFALFICFFPHLVAGPIMRASTLLPQVVKPRTLQREAVGDGLFLILIGLFKKVVIADNLATLANAIFNRFPDGTAAGMTGGEALVGLYAFAFQIYGDFSGYSAIARGISKLIGFELVVNFNEPYFAQSPSDFWTRWHISLSSWLRDYLYIPLGGNRYGVAKQYRNLMITMLLGGLWHGANWTFVAWGFYHGAILCIFRVLRIPDVVKGEGQAAALRRAGRVFVMFHLTCIGWLLFRADTFHTVVEMARLIVTDPRMTAFARSGVVFIGFLAGPLLALEHLLGGETNLRRVATSRPLAGLSVAYLSIMILFMHAQEASEFIYFQF
jgi:D-alanyl-lipoteichoic acid acyltransferase DltB (MBOAT superfamily)